MTTPLPRRPRAAAPPRRLTVTTLPSLDPVQHVALEQYFDTLFAVATRLLRDAAAPTATAA
jgi:hypothetical protein